MGVLFLGILAAMGAVAWIWFSYNDYDKTQPPPKSHLYGVLFQVFLLFVVLSAASHYLLNTTPGWSALILLVGAGVTGFAAIQVSQQEEPKKAEPLPTVEATPREKLNNLWRTKTRFEHAHILGATGAGKTELLKYLANQDIETNAAVIVMAPKGNLVPHLAKLSAIDADRLILVEPSEQHPVALNIFDLGGDANQTVSLLNFVFASTETTDKQATLLNYCIRLLLKVPNATLKTLRDLLHEHKLPSHYLPYVAQLSESGQTFFKEGFGMEGTDGYAATKKQLFWRIDSLLENPIIEKMLCAPSTLVSVSDVMAAGKVLLIDTSIRHLGNEGSSFFGRFFIALIQLATQKRDTSRHLRSVYVYIDELSHYLEGTTGHLEQLLDRAREAKVGLTLAHQQLRQLSDISPKLEASVHNTAIKLCGRVNDHDSKRMGAEMGLDPPILKNLPALDFYASGRDSRFLFHVVPGFLDELPQRTEREMKQLMARNSERVASPRLTLVKIAAEPEAKYTDDPGTKAW